jgi:putative tricarboxylic transport membrane protein
VLLLIAVGYALQALTFDVAFIADPLGPKAAPLLLAGVLAAATLFIFARPGDDPAWPARTTWARIAAAVVSFILYATLLEALGFVLTTTLTIAGLALLLGGRALPALVAGAVFSTAAYYAFVFALDVPLPIGRIFPFLGG